jgi:hypothetical protein
VIETEDEIAAEEGEEDGSGVVIQERRKLSNELENIFDSARNGSHLDCSVSKDNI